jgi:hypothetical protein
MSRITEILSGRFPKSYARHLGELLSAYQDSGLASPHLVEEVVSGEDGKLWARVWEAMLYRHLVSLGFQPHCFGMKKSGRNPRLSHPTSHSRPPQPTTGFRIMC